MAYPLANAFVGPALGTSPPSINFGSGGTDEVGTVGFGSGTSPVVGVLFTLQLGAGWSGYSTNNVTVILTPMNAATAALGTFYATWSGDFRTLNIASTVAPTASQVANTYLLSYAIYPAAA